jgi:hypothetical protein
LAALSVRSSTLRARFAACAMGWSALPYASGFFLAAWQSSQHGSSFLPSRSPSTASASASLGGSKAAIVLSNN